MIPVQPGLSVRLSPRRTGGSLFIGGPKDKVQVYVPAEDWPVVEEIHRMVELHKSHGIRTSFSAEALKIWKIGIANIREKQAAVK